MQLAAVLWCGGALGGWALWLQETRSWKPSHRCFLPPLCLGGKMLLGEAFWKITLWEERKRYGNHSGASRGRRPPVVPGRRLHCHATSPTAAALAAEREALGLCYIEWQWDGNTNK